MHRASHDLTLYSADLAGMMDVQNSDKGRGTVYCVM